MGVVSQSVLVSVSHRCSHKKSIVVMSKNLISLFAVLCSWLDLNDATHTMATQECPCRQHSDRSSPQKPEVWFWHTVFIRSSSHYCCTAAERINFYTVLFLLSGSSKINWRFASNLSFLAAVIQSCSNCPILSSLFDLSSSFFNAHNTPGDLFNSTKA